MVVELHNHQARSGQPVFLNEPTVTVRAYCSTDGLVYISTPEHELRPCRKMSLDGGNHQAGYGGPLLRCQNPQPTGKVRRYQMDWCTSVLLNTNYGRAAKCPSIAATTRLVMVVLSSAARTRSRRGRSAGITGVHQYSWTAVPQNSPLEATTRLVMVVCQNPQPTVKVRRYQMDWCTSVLLNTNYGRAAK